MIWYVMIMLPLNIQFNLFSKLNASLFLSYQKSNQPITVWGQL